MADSNSSIPENPQNPDSKKKSTGNMRRAQFRFDEGFPSPSTSKAQAQAPLVPPSVPVPQSIVQSATESHSAESSAEWAIREIIGEAGISGLTNFIHRELANHSSSAYDSDPNKTITMRLESVRSHEEEVLKTRKLKVTQQKRAEEPDPLVGLSTTGRLGDSCIIDCLLGEGGMGSIYNGRITPKKKRNGNGCQNVVLKVPLNNDIAFSAFNNERAAHKIVREDRDKYLFDFFITSLDESVVNAAIERFEADYDVKDIPEKDKLILAIKYADISHEHLLGKDTSGKPRSLKTDYSNFRPGAQHIVNFCGATNGGETRAIQKIRGRNGEEFDLIALERLSKSLYDMLNRQDGEIIHSHGSLLPHDIKSTVMTGKIGPDKKIIWKLEETTKQAVDVSTAYKMFVEMRSAIHFLASIGMASQDIKPENSMIDFKEKHGAELLEEIVGKNTCSNYINVMTDLGTTYINGVSVREFKGTSQYMNLELAKRKVRWTLPKEEPMKDEDKVAFRDIIAGDLYSLGLSFYEMVTGKMQRGFNPSEITAAAVEGGEFHKAEIDYDALQNLDLSYLDFDVTSIKEAGPRARYRNSTSEQLVAAAKQEMIKLVKLFTKENVSEIPHYADYANPQSLSHEDMIKYFNFNFPLLSASYAREPSKLYAARKKQ